MSIDDLDDKIGEKSSKNKYLTWVIIGIIIIAAIAVPMILLRQSEPAEATEPTTIEEIRTEVQTLWDTVYGTDGLETKIALHAESIADFVAGECPCPDWTSTINALNADIAILQGELDALEVTDWASNITGLGEAIADVEGELTEIEATLASLVTSFPRYAMVTAVSGNDVQIAVYGSGNFPVVVTFYGEALTVGSVSISSLYPYSVGSYYLYGGYTLTEVINITPDETGEAIPSGDPPNAHTHEVIVPYPDGELNLNGTMLVAIIVPDDNWEDGDDIILEVTAGTVEYVTATTG